MNLCSLFKDLWDFDLIVCFESLLGSRTMNTSISVNCSAAKSFQRGLFFDNQLYNFPSLSLSVNLSQSLSQTLSLSFTLSQSFSLKLSLSIFPFLPLYLSIYLSIFLSIYLSFYLSIYLSISLSLPLPLWLSHCISLFYWLCFHLSFFCDFQMTTLRWKIVGKERQKLFSSFFIPGFFLLLKVEGSVVGVVVIFSAILIEEMKDGNRPKWPRFGKCEQPHTSIGRLNQRTPH